MTLPSFYCIFPQPPIKSPREFFVRTCEFFVRTSGMADLPVVYPVAQLWAHPDFGNEVMLLKLAFGTASGFKGVHWAGGKWEARLTVTGKGTRVVWRCDSPKECAFILARLAVFPCDIPTPKKGRARPGEGVVRRLRSSAAFAC